MMAKTHSAAKPFFMRDSPKDGSSINNDGPAQIAPKRKEAKIERKILNKVLDKFKNKPPLRP